MYIHVCGCSCVCNKCMYTPVTKHGFIANLFFETGPFIVPGAHRLDRSAGYL